MRIAPRLADVALQTFIRTDPMKVLLAVDGSECSQAAERVLSQFPFETPPVVRLVHVVPVPDLNVVSHGASEAVAWFVEQNRKRGEAVLQEAAQRCSAWSERVETVLRGGFVAQEILLESETWKPDVVAIGARGLGLFPRVLLGSVSDRLVNHATCSVLVVHEAHESYRMHRILIADDGSSAAQAAVKRFASLPLGAVRSVKLLRVLPGQFLEMMEGAAQPVVAESGLIAEETASTQQLLSQTAKAFENATPHVSTVVETSADVAASILDNAGADKSELIVLGSQGHGAWERFFVGSVALRVVRHAACPVWLER
jgi:nucleotide-binding universal stress UspA family protein